MEQLALPFEEDLEAKAKRLFKELMVFRFEKWGEQTWALKWQDFHKMLLDGFNLRVEKNDFGNIDWTF